MKTTFVIFGFILMATGCRKDPVYEYDGSKGPLISQILIGGQVYRQFNYDRTGRLLKATNYYTPGSGIPASENVYQYDNADRLVKIETRTNLGSPNASQSYAELVYDAANRLVERKNYTLNSNAYQYTGSVFPQYDALGRTIAVSNTTYQYDTNNNVVFVKVFNSTGLLRSWAYEYDKQKNPLKGKDEMPYGVNENNVTKITSTIYDPRAAVGGVKIGVPDSSSNTYTYTSAGYPASLIEGSSSVKQEFKYIP